MRRIACLTFGLVLATALAAAGWGTDPGGAGTELGLLAVQQQGRRKPLDTLAREAIQQIHGSSSITLTQSGPDGETIVTWPAVAALLDWWVRPEFWDAQEIIRVESLPLRQTLLGRKLSRSSQWLAPKDLEDAVVTVDGTQQSFAGWLEAIMAREQALRTARLSGGASAAAVAATLSDIETGALEAGERLMQYKALRDRNGHGMEALEIEAIPRPANAAYLAFTRQALLHVPRFVHDTFPAENLDQATRDRLRDAAADPGLDAFEANALVVFARYIDDVKRKERFLPGTRPDSDARYLAWLDENAAWVPIRFLLGLDLRELQSAGYEPARVVAFRTAFEALEASERTRPGQASREKAAAVVAAARALGRSASRSYPGTSALALEAHYNRVTPFSWAPWAYGVALVLFLISVGVADAQRTPRGGKPGRGLRDAGIAALVTGIAIECYGFTLRVMISGWAPVTNMYETVIWVGLISAVLGLVLEWLSRRTFAALAASGIALLATVLAAKVPQPLLDPRIKGLTPVLRSNYWLALHVLTIVSSYAAFALALGLGLLAVGYYLTATYRRAAPFRALAAPFFAGLFLLLPGALLRALAGIGTDRHWLPSDMAGCAGSGLMAAGGVLTLTSSAAMLGEMANRRPARTLKTGITGLIIGLAGLGAGLAGRGPAWLCEGAVLLALLGAGSAALGLFGMASNTPSGNPGDDQRAAAMQATALRIKPLARFIDRAIQVGVVLVTAGTILGGVWADASWGRFWGWDPKEVWALITLLVYLVPLHGRFAGWVSTFGLVVSSVVCFGAVLMAWYGVNFVLGVGLHSYGFSAGGGQGVVLTAALALFAIVCAAAWRRTLAQRIKAA